MPLNVHFNPIDIQIRKLESIKIGSRTLASYTYTDDRNNYLSSLDYGNGDKVQYSYDKYGRLVAELYEDGETVTYKFDNSGGLASVYDSGVGITTKYYYDFTDRLMKYTATGTDFDHSVAYTYDNLNNLTGLKETINGSMLTTNYTYDDDNRVTKVENSNNNARTYTYDGFGRLLQRTTSCGDTAVLTEDFTFNKTNIESQKFSYGLRSVTQYYEYDDNGNIVTFSEAAGLERGEEGFCTTYVYDSQNQLIRENNVDAQKTWVWTYDNAGNITSRSEYAYTFGELGEPLDTVVYSYTNADWGDLLTSYDGKPITYDQIGNPLRIGSCRYSWEHGRQLASMFDGQNTAWHFTYDASGMRTSRSNGTTTYSYVYNGSLLMKMTVSNVVLEFAYDAFGAPMTITLNGSRYYYLTNVQGDVVSIVDADGVLLVHYVYDAWGNLLSTEGTMANTLGMINPLRYRGYVYDRETELYYLQSRYYNPEVGRFINADHYISTGQSMLGSNMFSYCLNNPVNYIDPFGSDAAAVAEFWTTCMWWLCLADGPIPAGDAIYVAGCVLLGVIALDAIVTEVSTIEIGEDNTYYSSGNSSSNQSGSTTSGGSASPQPPNDNKNRYTPNNEYKGDSIYDKNGVRVDYEYYGHRTGNVHIHKGGSKYYYDTQGYLRTGPGSTDSLAPPNIQKLLQDNAILKAIMKALRFLENLGGFV